MRRAGLLAAVAAALIAAAVCAAGASGLTIHPGQCAWPVKADPDLVNVAWPDEGARYWATPFTVAPGSSMTIRGQFPRGRYMSFHLYEGSTPVDAVTDVSLSPDTGVNPFVAGAERALAGTYTLHVVAGQRPATPQPNTLYAASLNGEPNVSGVILYRIYLPEGDQRGGVGLPDVGYGAGPDGTDLAPPLPPCQDAVPDTGSPLNDAIRAGSMPYNAQPSSSPAPAWGISRSRPSPTTAGPVTVNTGNVFFANFDNVYLSLLVWRNAGDLVALRARAPTFPDTRRARRMPTGQVRYWSICSNDFPTTRYVACLADQNAKVDRDGYFTLVISDPAHKPANLGRGDNWLPAGTYADIFLLYRQMLAAPGFAQAIERAPDAAAAPKTMGAYYPETKVCSTAQFEHDRCGLPAARTRGARTTR
jgi:hypothetical protein